VKIPLVGKLGKGLFATIDEEFIDAVRGYRWNLFKNREIKYARMCVGPAENRKSFFMHRVLMEKYKGRKLLLEEQIDHMDGDGLNNAMENLRISTPQENDWNRKKFREGRNRGVSSRDGITWMPSVKGYREISVQGSLTKDKNEALMVADCIYYIMHPTFEEFGRFNIPELSFESKWEKIGGKQRNQIRHSIERNGMMTSRIRDTVGFYEDMTNPHGVFQEGNSFHIQLSVGVGSTRKNICGASTMDKEEAYKVYDCIMEILESKKIVLNYSSISFEDKWIDIGEKQRRQILNSFKKSGIKTNMLRTALKMEEVCRL
jgi:hypothetical protein